MAEPSATSGLGSRLAEVEGLAAAQFIFLIAAVAGTVQAMPFFLHLGSLSVAHAGIVPIVMASAAITLVKWTGAALLWWFAVRRRQNGIWLTALHVTLGLFAGDLLMDLLGYVQASIETRGEYASEFLQAFPGVLSGPVGVALLRSAFWFVQAAALIAVGRRVLHMDVLIVPQSISATQSDPVL